MLFDILCDCDRLINEGINVVKEEYRIIFLGGCMPQFKNILVIAPMMLMYSFLAFSINDEPAKEEVEIHDDVVQSFKDYDEHYLDKSLKALEECHQANGGNIDSFFEPCSKTLSIMHNPARLAVWSKIQEFGKDTGQKLVKKHGEDKVQAMLQKKIGHEIFEKLQKESDLWHKYKSSDRLIMTQSKMRRDIDTRKFNKHLPRILGDICERGSREIAQECKELQGMFHRYEQDLRGEYSPFSPLDYDDINHNVRKICSHADLSAQTTAELIKLTQNYHVNGKCEEGPSLDRAQEISNDRRITEQFPEILKDHCTLFPDSINCAILREMVYGVQNPSKPIHRFEHDRSHRLAKNLIFDPFYEDRTRIENNNRKTGGDLCSTMNRLGCRSEEEVRQCVEDFNKLLHNEEISNEAQNIIDNFKSLDDFNYHITQDGVIITSTNNFRKRFIKEEQAFDCGNDLKKVLMQENGNDKNIEQYSRLYIVHQPFLSKDRESMICACYRDNDNIDRERVEALLDEVDWKMGKK